MIEIFVSGGFMMWPITVAAVLVILSAARAWHAARTQAPDNAAERYTSGVLFWGGVAAALGVLGTVVGIAQVAQVAQVAGSLPQGIVWGGIGVALVTTIAGLLVLLVALLTWHSLRARSVGYT